MIIIIFLKKNPKWQTKMLNDLIPLGGSIQARILFKCDDYFFFKKKKKTLDARKAYYVN
jgi:hypothetical protein